MADAFCGANSTDDGVDLTGMSIQQARDAFKNQLNIPDGCDVFVNGNRMSADTARAYVIRDEDSVEFRAKSGAKG